MTHPETVVIVAPFDAGSRTGGAARGAVFWSKMLSKTEENLVYYSRERGELIPHLVEHEVRKGLSEKKIPILLGGDHSLTYHALVPICSVYGRVNLVHFDAHHDAYPGSALNHYTVISVSERRLPVTTYGIGYRHESSRPSRLTETVKGPTYISIDVDYFDSSLVPSVGHAVPSEPGSFCDLDELKASLDLIEGPIVGADIVEWYGSSSNGEEHLMQQVFQLLKEKLRC